MIKYIKKLIRNNKVKRIQQIEPYKLFTEKCTKELKIISSFEEDDYCIKIGGYNNQSETVICPLDGTTDGALHSTQSIMSGFGVELYRGPGGHAKQYKNLDFHFEY